MQDDTVSRIYGVIASTPALRVDPACVSEEDDLYDAGLKSLAAVHLMLALEVEFGIEFPDSVLHRSAFSSIARIRDLIEELQPA
jgi:acyl carrier protein